MNRKMFVLLAITVLSIIIAPVAAKPSHVIEKQVYVHYIRGGIPSNPGGEKLWYKYSGIHWGTTDLPVDYTVNLEGSGLDASTADVLVTSFETWDTETGTELFGAVIIATVRAGSLDGSNAISWGNCPTAGVIAVTYIWYWSDTGEIVETDTMFDTDYAWSLTGEANKMDLQNIATHEFGHWLCLEDLAMRPASQQTMYAYSMFGETKKRTLESGDIAGLELIYGP